jgi:hypothetical protein
VNNADTPGDVRGLVVTGVGTVDCARHNMKRPNSIGDLQLREKYASDINSFPFMISTYNTRYVNMDFFFLQV